MNIWTPDSSAPPVSVTQIHSWEQQHRVRMPTVLRGAMLVHNGGTIVDTFEPSVEIRPLDEWEVLDEDDLEMFELQAVGLPYISFADDEHGGACVLDYTRCATAWEPAVIRLFHDGLDRHEEGADVATFIARQATALTDKPAIDGGHAAHLTRLGQTQLTTRRSEQHCLLGRDVDGRLIHMHYFKDDSEERWTTNFLAEPLDRRSINVDFDSSHASTGYVLHIGPSQHNYGREWISSKMPTGRWKNEFHDEYASGVTMYSQELEPLILLRQLLAGPPQTQAQAEADTLRIEYLRLMGGCKPKQKKDAEAYRNEVETAAAADSFDKEFGLDNDDDVLGQDAPGFLGGAGGLMSQLKGMASTLSGGPNTKVPEAVQRLIERLVAAEAAVEAEER